MSEIAKCPVCGKKPNHWLCDELQLHWGHCGVTCEGRDLWNQYAAVPDLYAALERIYGRLLMSDRDGDAHITEEDGAMAEAALRKARGEE